MFEDYVKQEKARNRKRRQLGTRTPKCYLCGQTESLVLVKRILCSECDRRATGQTGFENHHMAGRHNDSSTVRVPRNVHQLLTHLQQQDWPVETLRNPTGDPVLKMAATIRSAFNLVTVVNKHLLGWIPAFLERLSKHLVEKLGPEWWKDI